MARPKSSTRNVLTIAATLAVTSLAFAVSGKAQDAASSTPVNADGQIELLLQDHKFTPAEIHVPAGKPVAILMKNADDSADEFDSMDLRVEKVVAGGSSGIVRIAPLVPGRYSFMGEFHPNTAQGILIAE